MFADTHISNLGYLCWLLHMCFYRSKLRLGQAAQWQLFSQASMFNMFTALDGVLLEEDFVVFVSGL